MYLKTYNKKVQELLDACEFKLHPIEQQIYQTLFKLKEELLDITINRLLVRPTKHYKENIPLRLIVSSRSFPLLQTYELCKFVLNIIGNSIVEIVIKDIKLQ